MPELENKEKQAENAAKNSFLFLFLCAFPSSFTSDIHPGEGYHQTHHLAGLAAPRQSQRGHSGV